MNLNTQETITTIQNTWQYALAFGVPNGTTLLLEKLALLSELRELLPELSYSDLHLVLKGHMHYAHDYSTNPDVTVPY